MHPRANFDFALKTPGANIKAHGRVIIESGNEEYINKFKKKLNSKIKSATEQNDNLLVGYYKDALADFVGELSRKGPALKKRKNNY